jgi:hypothetical protein
MYRVGLNRRGKIYCSRFHHADKKAVEKVVGILNFQFPDRNYVVARIESEKSIATTKFFGIEEEKPKAMAKAA